MMPKIRSVEPQAQWGVGDALVFRCKSIAQWALAPLWRGMAFVLRHGVPPPVMMFPDSSGTPAQFPPLNALGFNLAPEAALQVWLEEDAPPVGPRADPVRPDPEHVDRA